MALTLMHLKKWFCTDVHGNNKILTFIMNDIVL